MGLFDLFRKKQPVIEEHDPAEDYDRTPSQNITINVTEEYVEINGKQFMLPIKMEELFAIFGEAQKHTFGKINIDYLTKEANDIINDSVSAQRTNFTWNMLGLYAYTDEGRYANALTIRFRPSTYRSDPEQYPTNMFGGTLTVNGAHWFDFLKSVEPVYSNLKRRSLGRYLLCGCFTDLKRKDQMRTEMHYADITISLNN